MPPYMQTMDYGNHFLFLHCFMFSHIVELATLEDYRMLVLHKNPSNSEIKGIHVYLKYPSMIE